MLDAKVALVTGGGAGIGRAIAECFVEAGATVAIADIDEAALDKTAAVIERSGGTALPLVVDCGEAAQVGDMVEKTVSTFRRIDILVNNAGLTFQVDMLAMNEADWDRVNRVNLKGPFFALQAAAKHMIAQRGGGRIINIASISGRGYANSANPAYAASKGGVIALTRLAAHHLAPHDITVNAICPGLTVTELFLSVMERRAAERGISAAEMLAETEATVPIGRANQPGDIAAMALFLAGEGGRNITGQAYNVDGGLMKN